MLRKTAGSETREPHVAKLNALAEAQTFPNRFLDKFSGSATIPTQSSNTFTSHKKPTHPTKASIYDVRNDGKQAEEMHPCTPPAMEAGGVWRRRRAAAAGVGGGGGGRRRRPACLSRTMKAHRRQQAQTKTYIAGFRKNKK